LGQGPELARRVMIHNGGMSAATMERIYDDDTAAANVGAHISGVFEVTDVESLRKNLGRCRVPGLAKVRAYGDIDPSDPLVAKMIDGDTELLVLKEKQRALAELVKLDVGGLEPSLFAAKKAVQLCVAKLKHRVVVMVRDRTSPFQNRRTRTWPRLTLEEVQCGVGLSVAFRLTLYAS